MLEVGTKAPEFTLPDKDGNPVSLTDFNCSGKMPLTSHQSIILRLSISSTSTDTVAASSLGSEGMFPTLYTPEEIAEIEAACLEIKETEAE